MALTNAERQRLFIKRLKAKATTSGAVTNETHHSGLAAKLDPLFDEIFEAILRGPATYYAPTDALIRLERALVTAGIMPGSRRTNDANAYARELKARQSAAMDRVFEASTREHEAKMADRSRLDILAVEIKALLEKCGHNQTNSPETPLIAERLKEAKALLRAKSGPKPDSKRKLGLWKKQIDEAWNNYCRRFNAAGARFGDGFIKWLRQQ